MVSQLKHASQVILLLNRTVLGLEVLAATQAADFVGASRLGVASKSVYEVVRKHLPFMKEDRAMYADLDVVKNLVASGTIVQAVEEQIGKMD